MADLGTLAGALLLRPGTPAPGNLANTRPDWVPVITRGKPAALLPGLLAHAFSLCGEAHRVCATLAVAAAQGDEDPVPADARRLLQAETLREHLRRMVLDWPLRLADSEALAASALLSLRAAPLAPGVPPAQWVEGLPLLAPWLAGDWLGRPAVSMAQAHALLHDWLSRWDAAPREALNAWCHESPGWLADMVRGARGAADGFTTGAPALRVHASTADLAQLSGELASDAGLWRRPLWRGRAAETGPWTRLAQPGHERLDTPWLRLGARLAETLRLALPPSSMSGATWLHAGRVALPGRTGLAWVEMARGLLVHRVQLEPGTGAPRVAACHVIAPTEWNFHPTGAVAQALAALPAEAGRQRILALMAAYDPCVRFDIQTAEAVHA